MASFTLTINLDGEAFHEETEDRMDTQLAPEYELHRLLTDIAVTVKYGTFEGSIIDINGHKVGQFSITEGN